MDELPGLWIVLQHMGRGLLIGLAIGLALAPFVLGGWWVGHTLER